jgi:hypothetical protein
MVFFCGLMSSNILLIWLCGCTIQTILILDFKKGSEQCILYVVNDLSGSFYFLKYFLF